MLRSEFDPSSSSWSVGAAIVRACDPLLTAAEPLEAAVRWRLGTTAASRSNRVTESTPLLQKQH
ncbi:hypothetical protein GQ600_4591 [Phytophthora cactorum]|nr:hypothetical protein GQ600_4591 [Phytophthora cactorum]